MEILNENQKKLIQERVDLLINQAKESIKGLEKVAVDQAWKMLQIAVAGVVQIIEGVATNLTGKDKKQLAITILGGFYDSVFLIIDIPLVPAPIESIIHKNVKSFLMLLVSSSIDATVTVFRNMGIFQKNNKVT